MGYYGGLLHKKDVTIYGDPITKLGDVNGDGLDEVLAPTLEQTGPESFIVFDADVAPSTEADEPVVMFEGETRSATEIADAGDVKGDGFDEVVEEPSEETDAAMIAPDYTVYGEETGKEEADGGGDIREGLRDTADSFVFNWSGEVQQSNPEQIAEIAIIGQTQPQSTRNIEEPHQVETSDLLFDDAQISPPSTFDGF